MFVERSYVEQIQIKFSLQLRQKLRNMSYDMDRKRAGMVLLHLRDKKNTPSSHDDDDD
jgi:hypothetical protein